MSVNLDYVIDAQYFYREISINRLIEILNQIKEDENDLWFDIKICLNHVGNLTILNKNDRAIGYIDLGSEKYFKFEEDDNE